MRTAILAVRNNLKLIEMKNLTSIAEHSEYLSASTYSDSEKWKLHRLRIKFGNQTLKIWMFVPCDEDGNVLEEKSIFNTTDEDYIFESKKFDIYQQAKEKVIFKDFVLDETYKRESTQLPYLTNGKISVFLHLSQN